MELAQNADSREQILLLVLSFFFSFFVILGFTRAGFFISLDRTRLKDKISFGNLLGAFFSFLFVQLIAVPIVFGILLILKHPENAASLSSWWMGYLNVITMLVSFVIVLAYLMMQSEKTKNLLWKRGEKKEKKSQIKSFFIGVSSWILAYPVVFFVGQFLSFLIYSIFGEVEIDQVAVKALKNTRLYPILYYSMILCMGVFVPIMEEILFRGFLQTWFRGKLTLFPAIVWTSLIFALFHFAASQGISNVEYIASLFLLSIFLGYLYEREMSLLAPIGLHVAFNLISILMISVT